MPVDTFTDWSGDYKGAALVVGIHTPGKPTGTAWVNPNMHIRRVKGSRAAWQYRIKNEPTGASFEAVGIASRAPDGTPQLTFSEQRVSANELSVGTLRASEVRHARVQEIEMSLTSTNFAPLVVAGTLSRRRRR